MKLKEERKKKVAQLRELREQKATAMAVCAWLFRVFVMHDGA